jgi:hypothetical protein
LKKIVTVRFNSQENLLPEALKNALHHWRIPGRSRDKDVIYAGSYNALEACNPRRHRAIPLYYLTNTRHL